MNGHDEHPVRMTAVASRPLPWSHLAVREAVVLPTLLILVSAGGGFRSSEAAMESVLRETLAVTRAFRGGREIISSLRASPDLAPVRLESHAHVAGLMAAEMAPGKRGKAKAEAYARARMVVELGYAAIEMLLEVPDLDADTVLKATARGLAHSLT